jgi:hypothetical protein
MEIFKAHVVEFVSSTDDVESEADYLDLEGGLCCLECCLIAHPLDNSEAELLATLDFLVAHEALGHSVYGGTLEGNEFTPRARFHGPRQ